MDRDLNHIRQLWNQEADKYVLKAFQEDIDTYDAEIRDIIIKEASQRGLIHPDRSIDQCDNITKEYQSSSQNAVDQAVAKYSIPCLEAPEDVKDSCFCPNCKSVYPQPDELLCSKCQKDLEPSGYCEKCDKFWSRHPGELCPYDQTELIWHKRSMAAKYLPSIGKAALILLFFFLNEHTRMSRFFFPIGIICIGMIPCVWLVRKILPSKNKGMLWAISWQASILICGVVAGVILKSLPFSHWCEFVLFVALLTWLATHPGIYSVMALTCFHVLTIAAGVLFCFDIIHNEVFSSITLTGLLAIAIVRCIAIILMFTGLKKIKEDSHCSKKGNSQLKAGENMSMNEFSTDSASVESCENPSTKSHAKHWILLLVGIGVTVIAQSFSIHNLSDYTIGGIIAVLFSVPIGYLVILGFISLIVSATRQNVRKYWFTTLAWFFLVAGLFDVAVKGYSEFVLRPTLEKAIEQLERNGEIARRPRNPVMKELLGKHGTYAIRYDSALWQIASEPAGEAEYSFCHVDGDVYTMIIPERIQIPQNSLREAAIENIKSICSDFRLLNEESKVVNDVELFILTMSATVDEISVIYHGYYYTGEQGTIQVLTMTSPNLFKSYQDDMDSFITGFRITPPND
ncbi:hypothetical protein ACFL6U_10275 [Planctomycetota bacterium]